MLNLDRIKAIIFDLDGVLVDTEFFQSKAWIEVLKKYNISVSLKDLLPYKGKSGEVIEKELKEKYKLPVEKGELLRKRDCYVLDIFKKEKIQTMPYAKTTLDFLTNKKRLALASTGTKEEVFLKLKKVGFDKYFSVITTRDDVKRGKPYPDIYLAALKKIQFNSKDCLAIEDTQPGVESAKSAGLICFAIPNEFSVQQNFSKADKKFSSLKEVVQEFKDSLNHVRIKK